MTLNTWAPDACTLPTAERPLRVAEFDGLFAAALRSVDRVSATRTRLVLAGTGGTRAAVEDLTARETACCSFFRFSVSPSGPDLLLDVEVPAAYADVLSALTARLLAS